MKRYVLCLTIIALLLANCGKKEDEVGQKPKPTPPEKPITPASVPPSATSTVTIEANKPYKYIADLGGANEPNQVYFDLATFKATVVRRDSWDIALYCGKEVFRAIINPAIAMTVDEKDFTDIKRPIIPNDKIKFEENAVDPGIRPINHHLIDDPRGILQPQAGYEGTGTAIAEISANDNENKVYLVNMGQEISTTTPEVGSVNLLGKHRGWMKIRITRSGNGYKVQYAKNDEKEHIKEVIVNKDPEYNFVFLNLTTGQPVKVQPKRGEWDLCFTPSTGWFSTDKKNINSPYNSAYYFPDMTVTNLHGLTFAHIYKAVEGNGYDEYTLAKTSKIKFTEEKYFNQMVIGRNWRDSQLGNLIRDELYYLIKDGAGNYYKLKFLSLKNDSGERGHIAFEYQWLQ